MRVCLIGGHGHVDYARRVLAQRPEIRIAGMAPGSAGEGLGPLRQKCAAAGQTVEEYEDYRAMLDRLAPDIAVIAPYVDDHARVAADSHRDTKSQRKNKYRTLP